MVVCGAVAGGQPRVFGLCHHRLVAGAGLPLEPGNPSNSLAGGTTLDLFFEPIAWLGVVLLSMLGVVGNFALYQLGKRGLEPVRERFPRTRPEEWQRVGRLYRERESWFLLLSAVPVLGALLTTAAGAFGVTTLAFLFWVLIAKLARNWLLVVIAYEVWLSLRR
jgi:membrane protein YqaA with SNARE-associated domain